MPIGISWENNIDQQNDASSVPLILEINLHTKMEDRFTSKLTM